MELGQDRWIDDGGICRGEGRWGWSSAAFISSAQRWGGTAYIHPPPYTIQHPRSIRLAGFIGVPGV